MNIRVKSTSWASPTLIKGTESFAQNYTVITTWITAEVNNLIMESSSTNEHPNCFADRGRILGHFFKKPFLTSRPLKGGKANAIATSECQYRYVAK